jgi:DNA-binding LytR/AlgR family response regulator
MDKKINILIVEDELIIGDFLKDNLEKMGYVVRGIAPDYLSAIELIQSESINLAIIDIKIEGKKTGIDIASYIRDNFGYIPFVFLTSFIDDDTIDKAKETNPAGYLTKPFTFSSVYSTIEIVLHNTRTKEMEEKISFHEGTRSFFLKRSDILFIESEHVYSYIVTVNKKLLVRSSLSEIMEILPVGKFARVHRGFIVNIEHIKQVTSCHILVESHKIPIGKVFKQSIESLLNR